MRIALAKLLMVVFILSLMVTPAIAAQVGTLLGGGVAATADAYTLSYGMLEGYPVELTRTVVPSDFSVDIRAEVAGAMAGFTDPIQVSLRALSPDGSVEMRYMSSTSLINVDKHFMDTGEVVTRIEHRDDEYSPFYVLPMLHFMRAEEYADYLVANVFSGRAITVLAEAERSEAAKAEMLRLAQALMDETKANLDTSNENFMYDVPGAYFGHTERTYGFDKDGVPYAVVINCATAGARMTINHSPIASISVDVDTTLWAVPFTFMLVCPQERLAEYRDAFQAFVLGTSISDAYAAATTALSDSIFDYASENDVQSLIDVEPQIKEALFNNVSAPDTRNYTSNDYQSFIYPNHTYTLSGGETIMIPEVFAAVYYDGVQGLRLLTDDKGANPGGGFTRLNAETSEPQSAVEQTTVPSPTLSPDKSAAEELIALYLAEVPNDGLSVAWDGNKAAVVTDPLDEPDALDGRYGPFEFANHGVLGGALRLEMIEESWMAGAAVALNDSERFLIADDNNAIMVMKNDDDIYPVAFKEIDAVHFTPWEDAHVYVGVFDIGGDQYAGFVGAFPSGDTYYYAVVAGVGDLCDLRVQAQTVFGSINDGTTEGMD